MSAKDRAYRHTKARILDGSLPGGDLIAEGQVADTLAMSRTPVREAFLRLEAEGLLDVDARLPAQPAAGVRDALHQAGAVPAGAAVRGLRADQPAAGERPGRRAVDGVEALGETELLEREHHAAGVGRPAAAALDRQHDAVRVVAVVGAGALGAAGGQHVEDRVGSHGGIMPGSSAAPPNGLRARNSR